MNLKKTVQEIFDEEGLEYKPTTNSLMVSCPYCEKKKRAVRKTNGGNKCYYCGNSMNIIQLLKILLGMTSEQLENKYGTKANISEIIKNDYSDLISKLDDVFGEKDEKEEPKENELESVLLDFNFKKIEESPKGIDYLIQRGITDVNVCIKYDLHYHTMYEGPVFPIKMYGEIVGWQCRRINPSRGPRMMSMPGEWKSKSLLNYDAACKAEEIGLFEGPFDALAAEQSGLVSVATLGKIVSRTQIKLLKDCPAKKIYIGFDPDAYLEVRKLCKDLCKFKEVYRLVVPSHRKDFGECTSAEISHAIKTAEPCYFEKTGRLEIYIDV